jgi:lipopolysaccharide transport system ATP-binding protein
MYHIQSLCQKALWLEHGRCAKQGDVFPVTQAYAAFMEAKSPKQAQLVLHRPQAEDSSQTARLTDLFLCNSRGDRTSEFEMGEDIVLRGEFQASEHESAVVMAGIVRVDGTPVYGTFSSDAAYRPHPAGPGRFAFEIRFPQCPLLPGRYRFRAHTLDRHGLRMYDTMEIEANIAGRTREHGVVRLRTEWR